jgi:threonylcarbamoyladenosine tRNA methylthiotransferase MtaB
MTGLLTPLLRKRTGARCTDPSEPVDPGRLRKPPHILRDSEDRGSSRSLFAEAVLKHVASFIAAGGNELVLFGINLGRWGRGFSATANTINSSPRTLAELVRHILRRTSLARLRLSSIEPMDWDGDLIGLMAEFGGFRLARRAHLPLQSGSDAVLRRMHRRYRPWHYVEKVEALLRAAGPSLTLGADVMVGFPGETEGEFAETLELVRALPFGYLHLFPFSPRPGTLGWHSTPSVRFRQRLWKSGWKYCAPWRLKRLRLIV